MGYKEIEKSLKDYDPIYDRPVPVRYDILDFSDEHRRLDALLRRFWNDFHPLVRDLFTSFGLEFKVILKELGELREENEQIVAEYEEKKTQLEQLEGEKFEEVKIKLNKYENQLEKNKQKREKLTENLQHLKEELKEKDALIVTQRRQLDNLIDASSQWESQNELKEKDISASIKNVAQFAKQLELLEMEMEQLEKSNTRLKDENRSLKSSIDETEDQYVAEIDEISSLYDKLRKETKAMSENISRLQRERDKYLDKVKELEKTIEDQKQRISELEIESEEKIELENQVSQLRHQLKKKEKEISDIRSRTEEFKSMANKIIQLKDKVDLNALLNRQEIVVKSENRERYSPSSSGKEYIFRPKEKTALERELEENTEPLGTNELEIERDLDVSDEADDHSSPPFSWKFEERNEEGQEAVKRISTAIESMDKGGNELVNSIRETEIKTKEREEIQQDRKIRELGTLEPSKQVKKRAESASQSLSEETIAVQEKIEKDQNVSPSMSQLLNLIERDDDEIQEILKSMPDTDREELFSLLDDFPSPPSEHPENLKKSQEENKLRKLYD